MIGIYKIISPSGKIYIGQSIDIEKRWKNYKCVNITKKQPLIYRSITKYGIENHIFEIIEECKVEELSEREFYWKQFYVDILGKNMLLFCHLKDGKGGYLSEETKLKISKANKGKPKPEGFGINHSKKMKGKPQLKPRGFKNGHIFTEEQKQRMRKPRSTTENMSRPMSEKTKQKISISNKNKPKPEGFGDIIRAKSINKKKSEITKLKMSESRKGKKFSKSGKMVIQMDLEGNFIKEWDSIKETGFNNPSSITCCCKGRAKTAYGFKWKYKNI